MSNTGIIALSNANLCFLNLLMICLFILPLQDQTPGTNFNNVCTGLEILTYLLTVLVRLLCRVLSLLLLEQLTWMKFFINLFQVNQTVPKSLQIILFWQVILHVDLRVYHFLYIQVS